MDNGVDAPVRAPGPSEAPQGLESLRSLQVQRLRWSLAHAYERVPHYRRAFDQAGVRPEDLDERRFADFLYTAGQPDPDLLIRTSGEMRVSNFLLWQIAYAEIWVTDTLWPEFRKRHLLEAIIDYQKRDRRYGGITQPVVAGR